MAKTTKSTKSVKTSKKPAQKSSGVSAWFKNMTPAKGLLLFAVVFAALGAGYYAYKSNAATITNYYDKIQNYNGSVTASDPASKDKYAPKVWNLPFQNSGVITNYTVPASNYEINYTPCVTVRRPVESNTPATIEVSASKFVNTGGADTITIPPSAEYASYCMNGAMPFAAGESGHVSAMVKNLTGGTLYVQAIYLGYK